MKADITQFIFLHKKSSQNVSFYFRYYHLPFSPVFPSIVVAVSIESFIAGINIIMISIITTSIRNYPFVIAGRIIWNGVRIAVDGSRNWYWRNKYPWNWNSKTHMSANYNLSMTGSRYEYTSKNE